MLNVNVTCDWQIGDGCVSNTWGQPSGKDTWRMGKG